MRLFSRSAIRQDLQGHIAKRKVRHAFYISRAHGHIAGDGWWEAKTGQRSMRNGDGFPSLSRWYRHANGSSYQRADRSASRESENSETAHVGVVGVTGLRHGEPTDHGSSRERAETKSDAKVCCSRGAVVDFQAGDLAGRPTESSTERALIHIQRVKRHVHEAPDHRTIRRRPDPYDRTLYLCAH